MDSNETGRMSNMDNKEGVKVSSMDKRRSRSRIVLHTPFFLIIVPLLVLPFFGFRPIM